VAGSFNEWFSTPRPWQEEGVESMEVEGELTQDERSCDEPAEAWAQAHHPGWKVGGSVIVQKHISAIIYRPRPS
jgi:hypothetical protein